MLTVGFIDEAHRARFRAGAQNMAFGTGLCRDRCGAKTATNKTCERVPLRGERRCLRHAGPAAAKRFRLRQLDELSAGTLDPAVWHNYERKRAVNRIRSAWRRDPWTPGQTLDLGSEEDGIRAALSVFGIDWASISPAALDAARWRYRRTHIDRRKPDDWQGFILGNLRDRIDAEGPPPLWHVPGAATPAATASTFKCEPLPPTSKRRKLDFPKPRLPDRAKTIHPDHVSKRVMRAISRDPDEVSKLEQIFVEHWPGLRPIAERLGIDFDDQQGLLRLTRAFAETFLVGDHSGWVRALTALKNC